MYLLVLSAMVSKNECHWIMRGTWKRLVHLLSFGSAVVGMGLYLLRSCLAHLENMLNTYFKPILT